MSVEPTSLHKIKSIRTQIKAISIVMHRDVSGDKFFSPSLHVLEHTIGVTGNTRPAVPDGL